ncbi:hypothetical protein CBS101457_001851 [Exobasidium rhododendri]|nr:hypothetical protein CBS101457_001851 [Exobasidium rhododendri]
MSVSNTQKQKEWGARTIGSTINQKSALSAAYAELGKELNSGKLKSVGSYTLGKMIGEGTYGKVRLGTHRLTGTKVAIKQVPKAHSASLTREIHHHRRLHHPNVMQLYEVMATESYIWMVTELCPGGELYDYLVERGIIPESEARRIFGQLCLAVAYVHDRGIVHRDLKLENVLLDGRCNVKLGDFGFTREFESKKLMETFCGTTGYAAPEMLAGRKYSGEEVDIWSLGVILYALLCGALPFDDDDEGIMKEKIMEGVFELPKGLSEESGDLISSILQQDPSVRPTIKAMLNHAWFNKVIIDTPMATVAENDVSNYSEYFPKEKEESKEAKSMPHLDEKDEGMHFGTSSSLAVPEKVMGHSHGHHQGSTSAFSESSFYSATSQSDSESSDKHSNRTHLTDPSTGEGETKEAQDLGSLDASLIQSQADVQSGSLALHRNESQTTIKREGSSGSEASRRASTTTTPLSKASSAALPTHHEAVSLPEQEFTDENIPGDMSNTLQRATSLEKRDSQSSHRGSHHRTPSRSKRTSSGGLSEHIPPILSFRPTNYVALLERSTPAMFSTISEQNILHQLSSLGLDVGQIVHSVVNEACDASGAMWWILNKKAEERQRQEYSLTLHSPSFSNNALLSPPPPALPPKDLLTDRISASPLPYVERPTSSTGKEPIKPVPVYSSGLHLGKPDVPGAVPSEKESNTQEVNRATSPAVIMTTIPKQTPVRVAPERPRSNSLSVRLSNVLAGKDKDGKKDSTESSQTGDERLKMAERAKSPVGNLMTRMSGASPASSPKGDKATKKDAGKSPIGKESNAVNGEADDAALSPVSKVSEEPSEKLQQSKSMETFRTVSSHDEADDDTSAKGRGRSSFLSTVRTWFEDKDKSGTSRRKGKQQQQQQQRQQQKQSQRSVGKNAAPSASQSGHIQNPHGQPYTTRSGSIRRTSGPLPPSSYGSTARRSTGHTLNSRGSLSRRSSSGSNHFSLSTTSKSKTSRRQSAGSITPTTAALIGEEYASALQYHHRISRPSSSQSIHRPLLPGTGLHEKSDSMNSVNSALRHQQHSNNSDSIRGGGAHGRRTSSDGGTTVRRHRNHPSFHQHHHAESQSRSRPTTPGKNGSLIVTDGSLEAAETSFAGRRSIDSDGDHARTFSPTHSSRSSQSVFVAHKNRTSYKPPSANPLLLYPQSRGSLDSQDEHGRRGSNGRTLLGTATWKRSWGKPPACWVGPVDHQAPSVADPDVVRADRAKLRDVFANKEPDDDWEDEEEEPIYAGGLGQLDSTPAAPSWSSQGSSKLASPYASSQQQKQREQQNPRDGMPNPLLASNRYAALRSIFTPPNLGHDTTPRAWTTESGEELGEESEEFSSKNVSKDETGSGLKDASSNSSNNSRVRVVVPAFKGADILEEDEEEEGM